MEQPTATIQLNLAPKCLSRLKKLITKDIEHLTSKLQWLNDRHDLALNYLHDAETKHHINKTTFLAEKAEYERQTGSQVGFYEYCLGRPVLTVLMRKIGEVGWAIQQTEAQMRSVSDAIVKVGKKIDRSESMLEDLKGGAVVPGVVEEAGVAEEAEIAVEAPVELEAKVVEKQPGVVEDEDAS